MIVIPHNSYVDRRIKGSGIITNPAGFTMLVHLKLDAGLYDVNFYCQQDTSTPRQTTLQHRSSDNSVIIWRWYFYPRYYDDALVCHLSMLNIKQDERLQMSVHEAFTGHIYGVVDALKLT